MSVHDYMENKSITASVKNDDLPTDMLSKNGEGVVRSIMHADEEELKNIAKAFARNEQKVVASEIATDVLLEELGRRFHAMEIRINGIKNIIEEG